MLEFTPEQIRNQMIGNPEWKAVFTKHHPDWTPENYVELGVKLFEKNGYFIKPEKEYTRHGVVEMALYKGDDFIFSQLYNERSAVSQVFVSAVSNHYNEVDYSTFK